MADQDNKDLKALEREIRVLKKKLKRSEHNRLLYEEAQERSQAVHNSLFNDLEVKTAALEESEKKTKTRVAELNDAQTAMLNMMEDFDAEKQKAEESQQQFESIVSNVTGIIYRCLLDEGWTMLFISDAVEEISGYPKEDFIHNKVRAYSDIIHPDDVQHVVDVVLDKFKTRDSFEVIYRIIHENGQIRWVRSQGQGVYEEDGTVKWLDGAIFDITEIKELQKQIESSHKHTRDSIEYASLIQSALVPDNKAFRSYFSDYFALWHPKDIVGGDIYLFEELRDEDECLLMVIDCTGHGVPGAFVTMLVKAIERQIIAKINNDQSIDVSPAWILSYFNRKMKTLLKQDNKDSISNAGFDGGVIYFNKKENILKFAGAETPLFYIDDDELKTIKGNRHSIGYKSSDSKYIFKDSIIETKENMSFYLTTDGYLDQNGGEKSFPFGKKRFKAIIEEHNNESMADQQEFFLSELNNYQDAEERNDDVTLVGFKI